MGYRNYIMSLPKKEVEKIRNMTVEELQKEFGETDDEEAYISLHKIVGEPIIELGKNFDHETYHKMCKEPLFTNVELTERFEEYDPHVLHEDALLTLANHFEDNVKAYFDELAGVPYDSERRIFDEREEILKDPKALKRMALYVLEMRRNWNNDFIVNKDKDEPSINDSWKYEHEIFDVLRIYKAFDHENNCLIIIGY